MRNVESFKAAYAGSFRTVGLDLRGQEESVKYLNPELSLDSQQWASRQYRLSSRASYPAFGNASTSDAIILWPATVWLPASHEIPIRPAISSAYG